MFRYSEKAHLQSFPSSMSANLLYWLGTLVGTLVGGLVSQIVVLVSAYGQGIKSQYVAVCPSTGPNELAACAMFFTIGVVVATVFIVALAIVGCIASIDWACNARNRRPDAVASSPPPPPSRTGRKFL
jgi:quinol-cytochrome oxidoreductase complex cytochrome b subunit